MRNKTRDWFSAANSKVNSPALRQLVDRGLDVELGLAVLAAELAQTFERQRQGTIFEHEVVAVVAKAPLAGDLHRRTTAPAAADAHPGGLRPPWPKGEVPPVPIQRIAAVVALFLLVEPLLESSRSLSSGKPRNWASSSSLRTFGHHRVFEPLEQLLDACPASPRRRKTATNTWS